MNPDLGRGAPADKNRDRQRGILPVPARHRVAPMHRVLSPAAECTMQTERTRYHCAAAKHLMHLGDRENANRVLIEATPQRSRGA